MKCMATTQGYLKPPNTPFSCCIEHGHSALSLLILLLLTPTMLMAAYNLDFKGHVPLH